MNRTTSMLMTTQASDRRGISLLEILFSIFILSVGLLGLASLIPAGTTDVAAANVADRAGNVGRAAFREVKVRNFTNHEEWRSPTSSDDRVSMAGNGKAPFFSQGWMDVDEPLAIDELPLKSPVEGGHSICIDPLFIARSESAWAANNEAGDSDFLLPIFQNNAVWPAGTGGWPGRAFPYYLDNDPAASTAPYHPVVYQPILTDPSSGSTRVPGPPRMSRVSLRSWSSILAPTMGVGLADRIFRWQDDLLFDLPTDDTLRPTSTPDLLQRGQSEGNYSWMATLTPAEGEDELPADQRTLYSCSVVVFYKRNLDMPVPVEATHSVSSDNFSWNLNERGGQRPTERVVLADFLSGGVIQGGGDVRLRLVVMNGATNDDPAQPEQNDFTNIRPNNWILLSGYRLPRPISMDPIITNEHHSTFQWFRVLAVGDGPTLVEAGTPSGQPEWVREVTLVGADWDTDKFYDVDDSDLTDSVPVGPPTCYATLVEGVVAVFTKNIPVETAAKH